LLSFATTDLRLACNLCTINTLAYEGGANCGLSWLENMWPNSVDNWDVMKRKNIHIYRMQILTLLFVE